MGVGYHIVPPPATGLGALGLLDATIHAFAAALQEVVLLVVVAALPCPSPSAPEFKVAIVLILHL